MGHRVIVELVMIGRSENEIGKAVPLLLNAGQAIESARIGEVRRVAERSGEILSAVLRMKVADSGVDQLKFKAGLDAVLTNNLREDDFGIADKRVLILRIAGGAAERSQSAV